MNEGFIEVGSGDFDYPDFVNDVLTEENALEGHQSDDAGDSVSLQGTLGRCPNCGADVVSGIYGAYCTNKCGLVAGKLMKQDLEIDQIKTLLSGEKVLLRNLVSKNGKTYDAYFTLKGVKESKYTDKDGNERTSYWYDTEMTFPERKQENN